jgi:hypothetical protein
MRLKFRTGLTASGADRRRKIESLHNRKGKTMLEFTKFTATKPKILSKTFRLDSNSALVKEPGGALTEGVAERIKAQSMADVAALLNSLNPANALAYGIMAHDRARIVTQQTLRRIKQNGGDPIIARTREHFYYNSGRGLYMLDGDFPNEPMTGKEYLETLSRICPALGTAPMVIAASASTHIYQGDKCLKGSGGLRVLVAVKDARDIPRAGEVFFKRCILEGLGYIFISKSGAMLPRTIIDASVWQAERLDFVAGAHCEPPLEQRRPDAVALNPDAEPLDTCEALPDLTLAEEESFRNIVAELKTQAMPEAKERQEEWISERVQDGLSQIEPARHEAEGKRLREVYTQAAKHRRLMGDFSITLDTGQTIEVGKLLDDPDKYHARRCADPLEPDYGNDKRIGYINLRSAGRAYIHSHAHGGVRYTLHRARRTLRIVAGERVESVKRAIEALKINREHYLHGKEIVKVTERGEIVPRDQYDIQFDLDGIMRFETFDKRMNDYKATDCKANIASGVMAARAYVDLPKLVGVCTHPTMDPATDRVIDADGYDAETGLMVILKDVSAWEGLPHRPTWEMVRDAVQRLWRPFAKFPFDSAVSRGVWLNAIITSIVRALLPAAPGTGITAPTAGSGKSLLAKCIAAIIDVVPAMLPDASDNEEIRKRLLALLRQGKALIILDNIIGILDSAALCVLLTSEPYQDRILGASETIEVPTRTNLLITGNNLTLRGDLCRRVLKAEINPAMETPWKRAFDLDPVAYCKKHRLQMIRDALTILRAGIQKGPKMPDRTASFELWSDTVRRAVCMVRDYELLDVADPVESIDESYSMDPETAKLSALMASWWEKWGDKPVKVSEIISAATDRYESTGGGYDYVNPELQSAIAEIAGEGRGVNSRRLGRWIERNRERIVENMRIASAGASNGVRKWALRLSF